MNPIALAYLALLTLPHGVVRTRLQPVLSGLRDELALQSGGEAQFIQEEAEDIKRWFDLEINPIVENDDPALPKGATMKDGKVYNSSGNLIEVYEGKWMKVVDSGRSGWWRFHSDLDGYCDNPVRGY
jgi:hypothetical protein